jgi:pyruvate, water dikinase
MTYIKNFKDLTLKDVPKVGGKNASLGQMIRDLSSKGIAVPGGFAVTADAYRHHLEKNDLLKKLKTILKPLTKKSSLPLLRKVGKQSRDLIIKAPLPNDLIKEITQAYKVLSKDVKAQNCSVAIRSSATAEDLPDASFAGQQETFLNVTGIKNVLEACRKSMASLFTDRAIIYRMEKGFDHFDVALSVGVQQMIRSDLASAGVMFTIDTETGFKESIIITSAFGLGETVVSGEVVPDEFHVFKPTLKKGFHSIIRKECGSKSIKKVFGSSRKPVVIKKVSSKEACLFSLTDEEVLQLADFAVVIEDHYSKLKGSFSPMDIEWAKDGNDGKLYIVQARPETVHATRVKGHELVTYTIKNKKSAKVLVVGQSIGQQVGQGKARVIKSVKDIDKMRAGDVLVTRITDPDWVPIMKRASAIITESGGRTCHAAIVSRELGIPAIVGAQRAMSKIKDGQSITIDCSQGSDGIVYAGKLDITKKVTPIKKIKKPPVSVLLNIASPDLAYSLADLPVDGVGLARVEFIIAHDIQIHPMAFIASDKIINKRVKEKIAQKTCSYKDPQDYFIEKLSQGVATIAASFYPRPVLVRFSDFKSNEYRGLLAGDIFEPREENPMIGWRGASRYYHKNYAPAFELECEAIRYAREGIGLDNINVMIPFVRTLEEAKKVIAILKSRGLESGKNGLKIFMMCELPSNVILIEQFAKYFDGFSIGSNDLTQTTLSVDRDSSLLAPLFDERDPAVKIMLEMAIKGAHKKKKKIGICGQAPSDHPEIAKFLIEQNIDSLSLNPDTVLPFLLQFS